MSEETRGANVPKKIKKKTADSSKKPSMNVAEKTGSNEESPANVAVLEADQSDVEARAAAERQNAVRLGYGALGSAVVLGAGIGVVFGPAPAVLTVAGIGLVVAIGLFWTSVRTLAGDAPLPEELELLSREGSARIASPAEARKATILLQLKDLERERALGKLNDEDYAELTATYREQAKAAMRDVEAETATTMAEAERLAAEFLAKAGVKDDYRQPGVRAADETAPASEKTAPTKQACPVCGTENDGDARFCKACAHTLVVPENLLGTDAPVPDEPKKGAS